MNTKPAIDNFFNLMRIVFLLVVFCMYPYQSWAQDVGAVKSDSSPAQKSKQAVPQKLVTPLYTLHEDMSQKSALIKNENGGAPYQEFLLHFDAGQFIRFTFRGESIAPFALFSKKDGMGWDDFEEWDSPQNLDVAIPATGEYALRVYYDSEYEMAAYEIDVGVLHVRNQGTLHLNETVHSMLKHSEDRTSNRYVFTARKAGYYQFELEPRDSDPSFELLCPDFTLRGGGRSRNSPKNRGLVTYLEPSACEFALYTWEVLFSITPRLINEPTGMPVNTAIYGQYRGKAVVYDLIVPERTQVVIWLKPEEKVGLPHEERYMYTRLSVNGPGVSWAEGNIDVEFNRILDAGTYSVSVGSTNYTGRPQDFTISVELPDIVPVDE